MRQLLITMLLFMCSCNFLKKEQRMELKRPEGRFILEGAHSAGYTFVSNSDTVYWINEMDPNYPSPWKITWITDSVFTAADFVTTDAGVGRVWIHKVLSVEGDKLVLVNYFDGICNVEANEPIGHKPDTMEFRRYKGENELPAVE